MNILLVTEFFPDLNVPVFTGGVEARCYFVAKYLAQKNRVTVLARLLENQKKEEKSGNLTIKRLGSPQKNAEASLSSLISRFIFSFQVFLEGIKINPDLVEGSNFITYLPAYLIAKKINKPSLVWYPDVFIGKWIKLFGILLGTIGELSERLSLSLSWNGIIAISNSTKNKILKITDRTDVKVISCGIYQNEFKSLDKFKTPTIIIISRLIKYKNVDLALKAFGTVKKTIKDLRLIIVGAGPEENNLKKLCTDLKLTDAVEFKKGLKREDLLNLLGKSHLLCHPSEQEGFGIVILEALASGTPYVATVIPSVSEITRRGIGGKLAKPGDVKSLAENITEMLKDQKLYNKCRTEGRELIKNYYWENIAGETYEYYRHVADL